MAVSLTPVEMLEKLIGFDTVSAHSNKAMMDFIVDYLAGHSIEAKLAPNDVGEDGVEKADLIATIGPEIEGGIVLSGHSDVVPVEGQEWLSDPFEMVKKEGRLYGRGTSDMKGFIAVALALAPEIKALDLKRPLHLVFSYDEELGCIGAPALVARLVRDVPRPLAAIIGEPTDMKLANAHKGVTVFETKISGKPAHSSQTHTGVNAIAVAAQCLSHLSKIAEDFKSSLSADERFEPPYSTISIGTIEGGTALNIVAGECRFVWDCRSIIDSDTALALGQFEDYCAQKILPEMRRIEPKADIVTTKMVSAPPLTPSDDNPAEALVKRLTGQNRPEVISFATEAGIFEQSEIPAVICGPGSIAQAHQANEFIELSQMEACADFLRKLAQWSAEEIKD